MKQYHVTLKFDGEFDCIIEAENEKDAIDFAKERCEDCFFDDIEIEANVKIWK